MGCTPKPTSEVAKRLKLLPTSLSTSERLLTGYNKHVPVVIQLKMMWVKPQREHIICKSTLFRDGFIWHLLPCSHSEKWKWQEMMRLARAAGAYPRTMMSLVSSCETQGLQSQRTRYVAQSFWRKRKVAAMRSRSFILLGPYWTADDSSVVKNSLWNTGGLWLKYLAANLHWIKGRLFMLTCVAANYVLIIMTNTR